MRYIFSILLCVILQSGFSQIVKTVGYSYTNGTPVYTPAKAGSALALDTVTWRYYTWNGSTWLSDGFRVQTISGCAAPAYTPTKFQSYLVINACAAGQGGPELYFWTGSVWLQINEGSSYTAGTGIAISGGNVISNTGDLSATNELVTTFDVNGEGFSKVIRLIDAGGTKSVSLPDIIPPTNSGTGISLSGTAWDGYTITNTAPNVVQELSIAGQDLTLSGGGGTVTIPASGGGSGGPDSTFAKTDGTYLNKRIGDNVYKNGTLGVGTTDTTGRVNIYIDGSTNTYSNILNYGNTSGVFLTQFKPLSQTDNPLLGNFNFTAANYPGINLPYSSRANHTWIFGYNVGPGGGRVLATDANLHISFESSFNLGGGSIGMAPGKRVWEWHLQAGDTLGNTAHRVISAIGAHDGTAGNIGFCSDGLYATNYNNTSNQWFQADRVSKTWNFNDSMVIYFKKNNVNAGGIFQRNAANTADLNLFFADNSDRIVVGGAGVSATFMPHGKLQMAGTGEIYNTSGQIVNIGNSGSPTRLDINSYGSEVLKLRSVTGGSATWTHTVNSDNYVVTRPDGANIMQFYNNAAVITSGSNKLGIGTDIRGRFTIQQISNTGQGGLMFVPTGGASEMYMQVNSSSQLAITSASGNERVLVAQDGATGIGASPAASAKLTVTSTTQGFLPPRMTQAQRDAISSPATGLTLYCTDCTATDASTGVMQVYNGTTWKNAW